MLVRSSIVSTILCTNVWVSVGCVRTICSSWIREKSVRVDSGIAVSIRIVPNGLCGGPSIRDVPASLSEARAPRRSSTVSGRSSSDDVALAGPPGLSSSKRRQQVVFLGHRTCRDQRICRIAFSSNYVLVPDEINPLIRILTVPGFLPTKG